MFATNTRTTKLRQVLKQKQWNARLSYQINSINSTGRYHCPSDRCGHTRLEVLNKNLFEYLNLFM